MTNREKYREEILKNARAIDEGEEVSACEFINRNVFPTFGDGVSCFTINCAWCRFLLGIWFDEEYEEPPKPEVDWDNVPVDTLVRVRNSEDDKWLLRYFHLYCEDAVALKYNRKYKTFDRGATSKTCMYPDESWRYCELVEEEENE